MTRKFLREDKEALFKLTDQLPPNKHEWDRVCAVLVTGKKWQFKDYPFAGVREGNMADLFTNICGFYFHYSNDPIPKEVEKWNVRSIPIDKNSRHKDIAAFREFWTLLDTFLKKKDFRYQY